MSLASGTRFGPYEIQAAIGTGGMGEVYKARDTRLDRLVAVKVLPGPFAMDPDRRARFQREARAIAGLNHPHICTLYDVGEHDGANFLVMELLDGETLAQLLPRRRMRSEEVAELGIQIADALEAAHEKGIIHRDIKPANIFITKRGEAKVLDFGLAKLTSSELPAAIGSEAVTAAAAAEPLTSVGVTLGTIAYMSPEQVRGQELDARTDLFSLGGVLYEMAAGRQAFSGLTHGMIFDAILNRRPGGTTRASADVPVGLEEIISRALEKDREVRCQSAAELKAALKRATRDREATSRPREHRVATGRIRALAVLPLDNLARDPKQDYFVDGMADALITELAQIHGLRVISRTSAMHYKGTTRTLPEIARALGVDGIVEGSVMREGERVRITAQLIHAATDRHLWARSYERDLRDVLRLQREVARAIADEVQTTLTPQGRSRLARARRSGREGHAAHIDSTHPRSVDPDAYQLYLKGQYFWNKTTIDGLLKAVDYLQQSIDKDPSYAPAYAWLANCYGFLAVNYAAPHEAAPKAKAAALQALALDSSAAEAHVSMAAVQIFYDWDWPRARHHLDRAIALSPSYAFAHNLFAYYLELMGDADAALTEILRAQELDPLALLINIDVGIRYYLGRDYARAIEQYRGVLDMDPSAKLVSYWLWLAYEQQGDYARAVAELRKLTQPDGIPRPAGSGDGILTREGYIAA